MSRSAVATRVNATVAGNKADAFFRTSIWDDVNTTLDVIPTQAERMVRLKDILGGGARRLPEGTLEAIARAPSRQARELNLRIAAGDLSAFPIAHQRAAAISAQLDDSGFMARLDEFEESRRIVDEATAAPEELARHLARRNELAPEVAKFYDDYNSVDARTLWHIDREVHAAQPELMTSQGGVYQHNPARGVTDATRPGNDALGDMMIDDVIAEAEGWGRVGDRFREISVDEAATRSATIEGGLAGTFTRESRGPGGRPIHRLFERQLELLNRSGDGEISDIYRNQSVIGGTNRHVRFVTAKKPQFLFDVTDTSFAQEHFQRMVTQASEIVVDTIDDAGNPVTRRLIDAVEGENLVGKMERILAEGDVSVWNEAAMQHFNQTVYNLNTKLDTILNEAFGDNTRQPVQPSEPVRQRSTDLRPETPRGTIPSTHRNIDPSR